MSEIVLRFDYGSLAGGVATDVANRTREIKRLTQRAAEDIVRIGEELSSVKMSLPHGAFGPWLHAEFAWTVRHAQRLMAVADKFKCDTVSHLDIAPTALYLLASGDVPEEARQEAVEKAKAGEPISKATARGIVARHRPEPDYAPHGIPTKKAATKKTEPNRTQPPSDASHSQAKDQTPTTPEPTSPPVVIETTSRTVPETPTAGDVLPLVSTLTARVKKVTENVDGEPFDGPAAARHCIVLADLLTGETPKYRLVKAGDVAGQAAEIFDLYPRRVARDKALVAIRKALKTVPFEELRDAVAEYARSRAGKDEQFTPHPATWFGEGRWSDDRKDWWRDESRGRGSSAYKPGPGERFDPGAEFGSL